MKYLFLIIVSLSLYQCSDIKKDKNSKLKTEETVEKKKVIDSIKKKPHHKVYDVFKNYAKTNPKDKDSIILYDKYKTKAGLKNNATVLYFDHCMPFNDNETLNEQFKLLKTNEWYEEKCVHKDFYYTYLDNVIILELAKGYESCKKKNIMDYVIDQIRIFSKDDYLAKAKTSNSVYFSLKSIPDY